MSAVVLVLCLAALLPWPVVLRQRRLRGAATLARTEASTEMEALVRLVRLTAADLRGVALAAAGHAEAASEPARAFLVATQSGLLDLAEALLGQTEQQGAHRLNEEAIGFGPVLDFAVARVAAQLGPGRRAWRLAPELDAVVLLADRRALHQILLRVLTAAALATGEGDWIDISAPDADGTWTLVVEDEGVGLGVEHVRGHGRETRGLGVGLALAHSLMQAHGGTLTLQSTPQVGTRAQLAFPAARLLSHGGLYPVDFPEGQGPALNPLEAGRSDLHSL